MTQGSGIRSRRTLLRVGVISALGVGWGLFRGHSVSVKVLAVVAAVAFLAFIYLEFRARSVPVQAAPTRPVANPHAPDASLTHATVEVPRTAVSAEDIKAYRARHPEKSLSEAIDGAIREKTQETASRMRQEKESDS